MPKTERRRNRLKIRLKLMGMLGFLSAFKDRKETYIDFIGDTVGDLLNHLLSRMDPNEKHMLLDEQGHISAELLIFLNGTLISTPNPSSQLLGENDFVEVARLSG